MKRAASAALFTGPDPARYFFFAGASGCLATILSLMSL
jgi:hypothetical protein